MGHDEQPPVGRRGRPRVERPAGGRPRDRQPLPPEQEEIEVEDARPPATTGLPARRALDRLQREEQLEGARRWIRAARHVEGDDGVPERRLVDDTDRPGQVEARDTAKADTRQGRQVADGGRERGRRVAEVGAEADVRPDPAATTGTGSLAGLAGGRRR